MSATLNDFRQISAHSSSIFIGGPTAFVNCTIQVSLSLVPLYKRSWKMFNVNACGGYRLEEQDSYIGSISQAKTKNGQFHYGFLTDKNVLSSLFGPGLNYAGGNVALVNQNSPSIFPILSSADLLLADGLMQTNDIQKSTSQSIFYSGVFSLQQQETIYRNLLNARTQFVLPFGNIAPPGNALANTFSAQATPTSFSQSLVIPSGFDYLVIFPFSGLATFDPAVSPVTGNNYGYYNTNDGFDLSSSVVFNMLPIEPEDFNRIIPVS